MRWYALYVTKMPRPTKRPPYPQAYVDSWQMACLSKTTKAHMVSIAENLKNHAGEYYGVRIFAGKEIGRLIYEWTLSTRKEAPKP